MENYFPFETIRGTQNEVMQKVEEALEKKENLLLHVPTGVGKTAAVLSPCIAYALQNKKTIFFLTPKHTQHRIALETVSLIKKKFNLDIQVVDLIGKKWMCLQPGVTQLPSSEFSAYCKLLREKKLCDYYENISTKQKISPMAKMALSKIEKNPCHTEEVIAISKEHHVCPYEISLLSGKRATVFIGDYYHILSESVRKSILERMGKTMQDAVLIFDEAHNLIEKSVDLLSSSLSTTTLVYAHKEAQECGNQEIAIKLRSLHDLFLKLASRMQIQEKEKVVKKEDVVNAIEESYDYASLISECNGVADIIQKQRKRSSCRAVALFLEKWLGKEEGFVRVVSKGFTKQGKPSISIAYHCLDPSILLQTISKMVHGIIGMSGTLNPLNMYKDVFGFEKCQMHEFPSPFPKENKLSIILPETTTRYAERNDLMFAKIALKCSSVLSSIPGNCVVFFPSYFIAQKIFERIRTEVRKTIFTEKPGMSKGERDELLKTFKSYKDTGAVLLACSSGSFGEGIDLMGDYLKGVIIVGLPLAVPDLKTKALIDYYNIKFNYKGFDYAYIYPAILKIMQNAGRCIRSETDRGVIVFMDERYSSEKYLRCFPKDENLKFSQQIENDIKKFFQALP